MSCEEERGLAEMNETVEEKRFSELLAMFNAAAQDLLPEDFAEREWLVAAFANRE